VNSDLNSGFRQGRANDTINVKSEGIKFLRSSLDKVDASLGVCASFFFIDI
jgi:hypothetical protein